MQIFSSIRSDHSTAESLALPLANFWIRHWPGPGTQSSTQAISSLVYLDAREEYFLSANISVQTRVFPYWWECKKQNVCIKSEQLTANSHCQRKMRTTPRSVTPPKIRSISTWLERDLLGSKVRVKNLVQCLRLSCVSAHARLILPTFPVQMNFF